MSTPSCLDERSQPQKSLLLGDDIETTKTAVRVPHQGYYEGILTAVLHKRHDGVSDVDPGGGMCTRIGGGVGRHRRLPRVGMGRLSALEKICFEI